jgi:putative ABC transport system ATP-binding protein
MTANRAVSKSNHPLCEFNNVVKTYKSGEIVCPVDGVSLRCEAADFISIEGPSGIGKSTLLYLAGGLLQADSGEVLVDATNLQSVSDYDLTVLRATKIGFIFQETNLFQALTVGENLAFGLKITNKYKKLKLGKADIDQKVEAYLEKLGLGDRRNFLPNQLSVGQRRRLVVARALIMEPLLVLADEPTNDLDDFWAREVMKLLQSVTARGGGVMMVTHNMLWAERANCRYAMNNGVLTPKSLV